MAPSKSRKKNSSWPYKFRTAPKVPRRKIISHMAALTALRPTAQPTQPSAPHHVLEWAKNKNGFEFDDRSVALFLVLINDRNLNEAQWRNSAARIHRVVELARGKLLILVKRTELSKIYSHETDAAASHTPAWILDKINFMLGGINFRTKFERHISDSNMMIAGAHIARPKTDSKYYPAIASLVATHDASWSHNLGSVRLQTHLNVPKMNENDFQSLEDVSRTTSHEALLSEMMAERFRTWGNTPPTSLFSLRESLTHVDEEGARRDCKAIKKAYEEIFWEESSALKLTYITVKHNATETDSGSKSASSFPFQDYTAEEEPPPKSRYHILTNENNWSTQKLARLTRYIIASDQLSRHPDHTDKALPLQYAEHLALRTFDCFRDDAKLELIDRSAGEYKNLRQVQRVLGIFGPDGEVRKR